MPTLTDRALRYLKPDDAPRTDSQVPGLIIRPNGNGGKWALRYVPLDFYAAPGSPCR